MCSSRPPITRLPGYARRGFYHVALLGYTLSIISAVLFFVNVVAGVLVGLVAYLFIAVLWYRLHYWANAVFTWVFALMVGVPLILAVGVMVVASVAGATGGVVEGSAWLPALAWAVMIGLALLALTVLEAYAYWVLYDETGIGGFKTALALRIGLIVVGLAPQAPMLRPLCVVIGLLLFIALCVASILGFKELEAIGVA